MQLLKTSLQIYCLNPKLMKNKALPLGVHICTQDCDLVSHTEKWLGTTVDKICIAELVPCGYSITFVHSPGRINASGVPLQYLLLTILGSSTTSNYTKY
jgi:hypothetical protein